MTAARVRIAAAVALVAAVALAAVVLVGAAGGDDEGKLAWKGRPSMLHSGRATDRILYGQVRNASLKEVRLDVKKARVLDASGHPVQSTVRFLAAFAHSLYPWSMPQGRRGDFERRRLGETADMKPGQTVPLTVSWRVPRGGEQPTHVDFGPVSIDLP